MQKKRCLSWIVLSVFMLTVFLGTGLAQANTATFSDIQGHWATGEIEKMVDQGIAKGYPDGSFKPDANISRAEFITMVNRAFKLTGTAEVDFSDVKSVDWFVDEVAIAVVAGYIKGYEDGSMKPNNDISRQEVAVIIARKLNLSSSGDEVLDQFKDKSQIASWSKSSVAALVNKDYIKGYPDQTFRPCNAISRAEALVMLSRTMNAIPVTPAPIYKTRGSSSGGDGGGTTPSVDLSSISNQTITVGTSKDISVIVDPSTASLFASSSKTEVATVKLNGKKLNIKGESVGTAIITVEASKPGYKDDSCSFTVTVSKDEPPPLVWDESIENVQLVSALMGTTVVKVFIKDEFVSVVDGVNVNGKDAVPQDDNPKEWRQTLDGALSLEDLTIVVSKTTVISRCMAFIDVFDILYFSLQLNDGITASTVTMNGEALSPEPEPGKYTLTKEPPHQGYASGDTVTFTVIVDELTYSEDVQIINI